MWVAAKDRWNGVPFTCGNAGYYTNANRQNSQPHAPNPTGGSVFVDPVLRTHDDYTLWLEYVTEIGTGNECFWLMWYDLNGSPTIPMSAVFDADQIQVIASRLASFIRVP
jgi:hypothetical protein